MTAIVRVNPIMDELEEMFKEVWSPWKPVFMTDGFNMDVYETSDDLVIKADLPGVTQDDLHVTLENDVLKIEAEKKEEKVDDGTAWYIRERRFGKYSRAIELPFRVAADKVSATLTNGVLEIRLPKAEEAKTKRIEVKVQ